ncbi:MAG: pheT [Candidatus Saccharibacteria bacterium]|nr:pheT [Candidatus Saccharibacteria bacterium]
MIISVNWLKKFTDIDVTIDELATLIGSRLVEIEEVIDLGKKYQGIIVSKVVECDKLEGSDHLNVTKIDDGGKASDVERDENGLVQVVCGAPNVRAGMLVAWLPPNSTVPESFNDAEPFVLGARKLRGVMSNGMLASAKELDLFEDHTGILEIDADAAPGSDFAEVYELNDYLLDIENKSLTHRPDTFGIVGFAREIAAIQGRPFHTPDWLNQLQPSFDALGDIQAPTVAIDDLAVSDRYQAIVLSDVNGNAQSPVHIQSYLARVGVRPINAIVDVTNYLMMVTGQPLHAFDYDKVIAIGGGRADIHVRAGRENETLELLDGRTIELTPEDIVIASGDTAIGLAGAMGGASTLIDENTKNIILESATFNLYNLRATQMRHGIFSEAITRFTKGQPAELTAPVLAEAARLMGEYANAKVVTHVAEAYPGKHDPQQIVVSIETINNTLGSKFMAADIVETLQNVEFSAELIDGLTIKTTAPFWRADMHIAEDIIEEIGRLNGFDSIEPSLPLRDFTAVHPAAFDALRAQVRKCLVRAGANEVLTYSFVHGNVLQKAGQDVANSYRITNSISPDLQYYRQSLTPSLLGLIHPNVKQGYDHFAVFEVNKTHPKQHGLTDENVPAEVDMIALTVTSKKTHTGSAFYDAKKILDYLGMSLGLDLMYSPIDADPNYAVTTPFEYRRSALVTDKKTDTFIGIVGEYKKSVSRGFKLPVHTAGFEIGSLALHQAVVKLSSSYQPLSRYPGSERDVCFQVNDSVQYGQIVECAEVVLRDSNLDTIISPVDIYKAENSDTKNVTIRIKLTAYDRTLTGDEVTGIMNQVTAAAIEQLHATIV